MISMTSVPIDTSCVAIKHQSTIARFGDSWDKTGIGITPDPFGRGAYNLQSISATRKKVVWFTRLTYPLENILDLEKNRVLFKAPINR